ncbi:HNH endonuclease [Corynebacterium heidelbergense]|uniref:HNH endonuclease n=1 Tax=Corynebacterium heidelbergense TaxID=2055947 RepID=A0A364V7U8_9CORY|nr:HNH endonuclease [Corynebacterium heidelbergense]
MRRFSLSRYSPVLDHPAWWGVVAVVCALILSFPVRTPPPPRTLQHHTAQALAAVTVVPTRVHVVGYSRQQFGAGWASSATPNGWICTTRELSLLRVFGGAESSGSPPVRAASAGTKATCPRPGGVGVDEYTGSPIHPNDVDIDHIFPLAAAWDMGAHAWSAERRREFANDTGRNLAVTASAVNRDKGDAMPNRWMPPAPAAHCAYVARFLDVAVAYDLAVTAADVRTARKACDLT